MTTVAPKLEIRSPKLFTTSAVVTSSLYGFILVVPVLVSMLALTAFRLGMITFLIPLGAIVVATFFLPFGFGNPYIVRLVRPLRPPRADQECYVVQLSREPRIRSGFMAVVEDADDVGVLSYTESTLEFHGDSVQLSVPYGSIRDLKQHTAGARALFAYGPTTAFSIAGLPEGGTLRFAERYSSILPGSRRNALRMYQGLRKKVDALALPCRAE